MFAGIDGSGKSTAADLLASRLASRYSVTRVVNKDATLYVNGKKHMVFQRFYHTIEYLRPIARKYHLYGLFLVVNYIYKFMVSKYLEKFHQSDFLVYEIDTLLHPAVYITYHFPITRFIRPTVRFRIVKALFGRKRNFTVFHLDTRPDVAMERIHKRAAEIHPHENPADLAKLKNEFDRIIEVARSCGFDIRTVETDDETLDQVVDCVEAIILDKMSRAAVSGERQHSRSRFQKRGGRERPDPI